jgi:hypothetical protein
MDMYTEIWWHSAYFLQEVGDTLPFRASETHELEKLKHIFSGALVDNLAV